MFYRQGDKGGFVFATRKVNRGLNMNRGGDSYVNTCGAGGPPYVMAELSPRLPVHT